MTGLLLMMSPDRCHPLQVCRYSGEILEVNYVGCSNLLSPGLGSYHIPSRWLEATVDYTTVQTGALQLLSIINAARVQSNNHSNSHQS
jgi:hypothetical protein